MKCQQCGVNRATVNMAMQINNERKHLQLMWRHVFKKFKVRLTDSSNFFSMSGDYVFKSILPRNYGWSRSKQNDYETATS